MLASHGNEVRVTSDEDLPKYFTNQKFAHRCHIYNSNLSLSCDLQSAFQGTHPAHVPTQSTTISDS